MTEKTQVYNLVILDRSGSMDSMRQAALDGFNETLAGIKAAQAKYSETQTHFISLLSFCACTKAYTYDRVSIQNADPLQPSDYVPCCGTPLHDAMGEAITSLESHVKDIPDVSVLVTIITDGHENSSRTYTSEQIKALVTRLEKDEGWNFTYMGANQDSVFVGQKLGISQVRNYQASSAGMTAAYQQDPMQCAGFFGRIHAMKSAPHPPPMPVPDRKRMYSRIAAESYMEAE